jgi:hypothetical protein
LTNLLQSEIYSRLKVISRKGVRTPHIKNLEGLWLDKNLQSLGKTIINAAITKRTP